MSRLAGLVLPVLPEGLALADAPAAMHALGHRDGDPLRLDEEGRQLSRQLLGAMAKRAVRGG